MLKKKHLEIGSDDIRFTERSRGLSSGAIGQVDCGVVVKDGGRVD